MLISDNPASITVRKSSLDKIKVFNQNCDRLKDSGADLDMGRIDLVPEHHWVKLDKPLSLGSVERPNAMTIRYKAVLRIQEANGQEYDHEFALAKLPPGPDVICGNPWIEVHCPEALAALEAYGGAATEKPHPSGLYTDLNAVFSAGGELLPQYLMDAVESEEETRRILVAQWVQHIKSQNWAYEILRTRDEEKDILKSCGITQTEDNDSGYETDDTEDPELPAPDGTFDSGTPPIRGLKRNAEGWQDTIPKRHQKNIDVFEDITPDFKPVSIPGYDCDIELKPGMTLKNQAPYKMTAERERWMKLLMTHRLKHGINEESMAENCCPVFWVRDPASAGRNDGKRQERVVDDLRDLNRCSVTKAWPLPRIDQMIDRLAAAKFIGSTDVKSAYDTVPLTQRSKDLTTFILPWGKYRWTVMPQGFKNAPAVLQARYTQIFNDLMGREGSGVFIYMDDFYPYAETQEDLDLVWDELFRRARKFGLRFSPKKTEWNAKEINCLGFVIEVGKGVKMQKDKVALIHALKPPQNKEDILVMQGTINFYNRYIPHFSDKASCITEMLKKDVPFVWSRECQDAWLAMCKWVREDVYQQPYDPRKSVVMYTDASDYALGIVIMQPRNDDPSQLGLVLCAHRKFRGHEKGWGIPDKELFAGIHAFRKYRYMLDKCEWRTDHKNLAAFLFDSDIAAHEGRRARWLEEVGGYDFTIVPVGGKEELLQLADFQSRYGYPPVSSLDTGNPLVWERFKPKTLVDIASWFRFEGMGLRERLEKALATGDRKKARHLGRTADKIESKADEIDGHLEGIKAKLEQGSLKLGDSTDFLMYFAPVEPETQQLNDSEHAEHAHPDPTPDSARAAPLFCSEAISAEPDGRPSLVKFLTRQLTNNSLKWTDFDKERANRWLSRFFRIKLPSWKHQEGRGLARKPGRARLFGLKEINWDQDMGWTPAQGR
jgi:hypothetical protein